MIVENIQRNRTIGRFPLIKIGSVLIAMLLITVWVFSKATPSSEAARLRNALLAEVGNQSDFNWLPSEVPASFREEDISATSEVSTHIVERLGNISGSTQFDKSLVIARLLLSNDNPRGGAIMSNTSEALRLILDKGKGYCADFTQVFNGVAYLHDISVREWGLSFDGFGGKGHAVSEIYDEQLKKWVLLDIFNGFYLVDQSTNVPLSVIEFQTLLQTELVDDLEKKIKIVRIKSDRFGFRNNTRLFKYFARGKNHFYLWWGNDALSYDDNVMVSWASKLSRYVEQLVAIGLGVHQQIHIRPNRANKNDIANLLKLRTHLLIALLLEIIFGVVFIFLCLRPLIGPQKNR